MTTHPAPDPFAFRPDLIRREPYVDAHGRLSIDALYLMPDGRMLGIEIRPNDDDADRTAQWQLEAAFQDHVASLTAHQRMTWAAAAMADGVAA